MCWRLVLALFLVISRLGEQSQSAVPGEPRDRKPCRFGLLFGKLCSDRMRGCVSLRLTSASHSSDMLVFWLSTTRFWIWDVILLISWDLRLETAEKAKDYFLTNMIRDPKTSHMVVWVSAKGKPSVYAYYREICCKIFWVGRTSTLPLHNCELAAMQRWLKHFKFMGEVRTMFWNYCQSGGHTHGYLSLPKSSQLNSIDSIVLMFLYWLRRSFSVVDLCLIIIPWHTECLYMRYGILFQTWHFTIV